MLSREAALMQSTPVNNIFISEYMRGAPDGFVSVYLYALMCCTTPQLYSDIGEALGMEHSEVDRALNYWQAKGLIELVEGDERTVRFLSFSLDAPAPTRENSEFVIAVQKLLNGRALTSGELSRIYDWLDIFKMDEACALMLIRYCVELKGSRVSVAYMDAVAKTWTAANVLDAAAAEAYISDCNELSGGAQAILRRWRKGRRPTEDELALYKQWLAWGFDAETISAACTEMTGADNPSFKYLNSILESFRMSGAHDPAAVRELMKKRDEAGELARLIFARAGIKRAPSLKEVEQIQQFTDVRHMGAELLLYAAECSRDAAQPFSRFRKFIDDWYDAGVKTVLDAQRAIETAPATAAKQKKASGFIQRAYGAEQLKSIGIKLIDDEDE